MKWGQVPFSVLFSLSVAISLVFPSVAHATDLNSLTSVDVSSAHITPGDTVTRDEFNAVTNVWTFNFSWPYPVPNSRSRLAVFRGTFGAVEGETLASGVNYGSTNQAWGAGNQSIVKQISIPPLTATTTPSGVYTVVIADISTTATPSADFAAWLESGGSAGAEPNHYAMFSFTYEAVSTSLQLSGAINHIETAINAVSGVGRTIVEDEQVYRSELGNLNGTTDTFWRFDFDWPNAVANQQALFMVFRGAFGDLEGGTPTNGVNYGYNLQSWPTGHSVIGKFINLPPLKHGSTTPNTYTIMVAERDPKYLAEGVGEQALWFASGGTQGIGPRRYSLHTFKFKGDDPYPVVIVPGILGSAQDEDGEWVLDPITHVYDNLYETLDLNGYSPGEDLFTFPYDWRRSNVETALLLRDKINAAQSVCHCRRVDLVAHSMGGLVSRQYIQSDDYEDDVNHMIFLGTPHLGAPKAYLMWEAGETDTGFFNFLLKLHLEHIAIENGFSDAFEYIRLGPVISVKELLASYDYLYSGGSLLGYPGQYPSNQFLEALHANVGTLASRVSITNVVGDTNDSTTLLSMEIIESDVLPLWFHGKPVVMNRGSGDGTVPLSSASGLSVQSTLYNSPHNQLPTNAQEMIVELLTGRPPSGLVNHGFISRVLLFKMFSPADMTVTDPNGRRVGRDGGSTVNEIPGAYYTGFNTNTEFIVIPDPLDGEYQVQALGTGVGGEFRIAANYITEDGYVEDIYVDTIAPGETNESIADLDTTQENPLDIHSLDEDPPVITVLSPLAQDYLHSAFLDVDFTVSDEGSGVDNVEILLDAEVLSDDPIDLFYLSLGNHTFSLTATDNLGNATTAQVPFMIIATPESTIQDIERAYSLGWVTNYGLKNELIRKMRNGVLKVKELDAQLGKGITQQAYDVLRADIEWMMNNL